MAESFRFVALATRVQETGAEHIPAGSPKQGLWPRFVLLLLRWFYPWWANEEVVNRKLFDAKGAKTNAAGGEGVVRI